MCKSEKPEHYLSEDYDHKGRFMSYWHQASELRAFKPKKVLEIGVGNGFLSGYLRSRGMNVTTVDIDPALKPDITGSVLSLPLADGAFDVVGCFEVLEHLPFEDFPKALSEMRRVCTAGAVISVPDHTPVYRFDVELPLIGEIRRLIPHPFPRLKPHEFDGTHYWMIGAAQFPLKRVLETIKHSGFRIRGTYRVFEFYGHRFFVLEKV
jgi:SAM-dependent methyltransferase